MESATKGAVEGALDWSADKVVGLVKKFLNRELAFVEDKKNVETIKTQRESAEYRLLRQFVPKGPLPILFQVGLALREMERDKDRVKELKDDVHAKHGTSGVHIAELVQIGVITQLLARLVRISQSSSDVQKRLTSFLEQVDFLTLFVRKEDEKSIEAKSKLVRNRVDTNPTRMMILFGSGYAKNVVVSILKKIGNDPRNYMIQTQDEGFQIIGFVFAPELRAKLTHWSDTISEEIERAKRKPRDSSR